MQCIIFGNSHHIAGIGKDIGDALEDAGLDRHASHIFRAYTGQTLQPDHSYVARIDDSYATALHEGAASRWNWAWDSKLGCICQLTGAHTTVDDGGAQ